MYIDVYICIYIQYIDRYMSTDPKKRSPKLWQPLKQPVYTY